MGEAGRTGQAAKSGFLERAIAWWAEGWQRFALAAVAEASARIPASSHATRPTAGFEGAADD